MTTTPAGWYDDGNGALRWWDGTQWTENVQPLEAPTEAAAETATESADAASAAPAEAAYAATPAGASVPGVPPAGYPGAYTGQGGAFIAATEPKKSRMWILWVVIGVVLIAVVAVAAILIPMLFLNGGAGSSADNDSAVASVKTYDAAWRESDCDKFFGSTTEKFRNAVGLTECDGFTQSAASFAESVSDYKIEVTDVTRSGDEITVTTTETYNQLIDESGAPLDTPQAYADHFQYVLVKDGAATSGWGINDAFTQQSQ